MLIILLWTISTVIIILESVYVHAVLHDGMVLLLGSILLHELLEHNQKPPCSMFPIDDLITSCIGNIYMCIIICNNMYSMQYNKNY